MMKTLLVSLNKGTQAGNTAGNSGLKKDRLISFAETLALKTQQTIKYI
ncbi:MAG: hypothetical protein K0S23_302 [Fluviicola sp.]|jgi:hypothetical protein|nr:hypothetical protein [Fluviicola sp.]